MAECAWCVLDETGLHDEQAHNSNPDAPQVVTIRVPVALARTEQ